MTVFERCHAYLYDQELRHLEELEIIFQEEDRGFDQPTQRVAAQLEFHHRSLAQIEPIIAAAEAHLPPRRTQDIPF